MHLERGRLELSNRDQVFHYGYGMEKHGVLELVDNFEAAQWMICSLKAWKSTAMGKLVN